MDDMGSESFGKLFVWLTASVSSASQGVGEAADGSINLQKLPDNIEKVETPAESLEDGPPRQVFLRVRCSVKRFPYLMRYRFDSLAKCYQPSMSHQLSEEEARATGDGKLPDISSDLLNGVPRCPWCGNPNGAQCGSCGTMFCADINGSDDIHCPGCHAVLVRNKTGSQGQGFNLKQSGG
jgi:hypothetical protein